MAANAPLDSDVEYLAEELDHQLDLKPPPLISSISAPPVLQSDYVIQEGYTFGSCPAHESDFLGTPAAEKGAFEYPETSSASSSRRPSLIQPSLRRGSSTSSATSSSTITAHSTRRPSLAPLYVGPLAGPSDYDMARRRGSLAHFPAKPVHTPIPPSLLARRGSLPAADALFGVPANERRGINRASLSSLSPVLNAPDKMDTIGTPHSPPPRPSSFRLRMPPSAFARRGSLPMSPRLSESVAEQAEPHEPHIPRNRQSSSASSARGSNLSRSSISSEDAMQDEDESTSTDEFSAVDTPSSVCESESHDLFSDPWAAGRTISEKPSVEAVGAIYEQEGPLGY